MAAFLASRLLWSYLCYLAGTTAKLPQTAHVLPAHQLFQLLYTLLYPPSRNVEDTIMSLSATTRSSPSNAKKHKGRTNSSKPVGPYKAVVIYTI